jgi:hypothetical protein
MLEALLRQDKDTQAVTALLLTVLLPAAVVVVEERER